MTYTPRDKHFAHKTFRLMHKASVPAEIGRDAFCIVAVILHTEDAARYRGPVSFYNSQLMETLGFAKWETFDKARQKAIDAGWLAYTCYGNRKPGVYYVTIPEQYGVVEDGLIDDSYPENGYKQGYNEGYNNGYNKGYNDGVTRGITGGTTMESPGGQLGGTSYPNPNPNPNPNPITCSEVKTPSELVVQQNLLKPEDCQFPIFPCAGEPKFWQASSAMLAEWAMAFPGIDIESEIRKSHAWVKANIKKRKTADGMQRFLVTWFTKSQNGSLSQSADKPRHGSIKPKSESYKDDDPCNKSHMAEFLAYQAELEERRKRGDV